MDLIEDRLIQSRLPQSRIPSPESPVPNPQSRAPSPESPVPSPQSRAPCPEPPCLQNNPRFRGSSRLQFELLDLLTYHHRHTVVPGHVLIVCAGGRREHVDVVATCLILHDNPLDAFRY